ncbi:MAG: CsgG/HfaB family protein [Phycisphaeraceae bacterium]
MPNRRTIHLASVSIALAAMLTFQAAAWGQAKTLAISDVKIAKTLNESVKDEGKKASLGRVSEAMDSQMIDRFQQTRKFKIIARSDLDSLLKEQGLADSGNVDTTDPNAAKSFMIKGVEFLLITTIDDFQDFNEEANFAAIGEKATKRVIRLSAIGKLYNSTTGELLESTNLQISNKDIVSKRNYSTTDGKLSDALLLKTARDMADKMANRVADVIFPAKIIALTGQQVTINRGDGTDIAVGQVWIVHKLGEMLKDPDTGEVLGREELQIGKIRVTSVQPKMSKGEIIEGNGVTTGDLLRLVEPEGQAQKE